MKNISLTEKAKNTEPGNGITQYADTHTERVPLKAKLEVMKVKVAVGDIEMLMSQKVKGKEETL